MLVSGMVATDTPSNLTQGSTKSMIVDSSSTEAALGKVRTTNTSSEVKQASKQPSKNYNANVETKVREYFADIPLMAEISKCESHFRQFEKDGSIFRGKVNDQDVGAMQINEYYHRDRSIKLGYDIRTLEGNMAYARVLYEEQGGQPWVSSSPCWKKSDVAKAIYGREATSSKESMKIALIEDFKEVRKNNAIEKVSTKVQNTEVASNTVAVLNKISEGASKLLADNI